MDYNENRDYEMNNYNENNEYQIFNEHETNNMDYESNNYNESYDSYNQGYSENVASDDTEYQKSYDLKEASFYTESYVKPEKKKKGILGQLILVSVISSLLGGATVGAFLTVGAPVLRPSINSFLNEVGIKTPDTSSGVQNAVNNGSLDAGSYKKVVIENSDSAVVAIAEKVGPSVVGISVSYRAQTFLFGGVQEASSAGSGIIIRSDGYIMTNNHVISEAMQGNTQLKNGAKIEVILPNELDNPYTATVVGRDAKTDLAVLKINATNLPAIEMGDSDKVRVGELAVAIGNPGGLEYMGSVTVGVISGLNRSIPLDESNELKLIQTDAAINPGNSGGALVNAEGKLIGVNTAKISGDGFEGLGFAIPVNKAKEIVNDLIEYKYVKGRPSIGISVNLSFNEQIARRYNVPAGVLVEDVVPLSGAYKAGIKRGDIITKVDGVAVKAYSELEQLKNKHKVGETIKLEIYRDGTTLTVDVVLGEDMG
ncbi:MAG TPA: trypsin-like peptidase domain-containing protein [Acetivibrio clariflavus]|nr:trypsin-like peptidase domain-containing protein [Acetivibrio clariflavus]